ncbi:MAG: hypothetical protein DYG89_06040 [Caldilinea sp. CFX5]|nr:hypothetical protein [Caldilinea sp. CFX5]
MPGDLRRDLWIIPQKVKIGSEFFYIDKHRIDDLYSLYSKYNQPARFYPVSLGEIVRRLDKFADQEEIVLLIPGSNFDATPYANLVQGVIPENTRLYTCTFNCYGHALAYLLQGALHFINTSQPSVQQIKLYVDSVNESLHSFLFSNRTRLFEPNLAFWLELWSKISQQPAIYQSHALHWRISNRKSITKAIARSLGDGVRVWIESHHGSKHARMMVRYLQEKKFDQKQLATKELRYASRSLPDTFSLVTITPNKTHLEQIGQRVQRWQAT